ncbi:ligase-associated DNA damage response exonuclease [Xanthobacter dioxanivorans]|uniref:Ligase-associated DNA damage response exonuclease n=1 Tax=Xanthobacter dioxanivorans TaxID=2528964 RepID=A0A974PMQ3_9HYPH|nr:ligase-associated DNA damage response exonuclease [Xanthobacter dioxanivorans]QRG06437.1 ligase-associated DNA damage response exonuclease [Xanthobacter dioxanivorans]
MRPEDLLRPSPKGLYSPAGDFFVDPTRAVPRAVITHGHSDHARAGHAHVLATRETLDLMAIRYGASFAGATQPLAYGERVVINGVGVSLHPAGHVLGSAQVRLEKDGLVIVVSGDYKDASDPTCAPFEPVRCHVFVSEATFGLPVFRHPPASAETAKLLASVRIFPERTHIVGAYSLGKAQRMMALMREAGHTAPLYVHGALTAITDYYVSRGIALGEILPVNGAPKAAFAGAVVIAPPSSMTDMWARRFADPITCFASGWMRVRARARQRGVELPLVVSDHADWDGLCASIRATGCEEVWVTHGAEDALVHWARTRQLRARPLRMVGYGEEDEEGALPAQEGEA